jgi:hypothetical protein
MAQPNWDEEKILEWEFEYARSTAEQAQDDRTAMVNLYLILVGGVGSILLALPQLGGGSLPPLVHAGLFGLLTLTGFFIVLTLIRLRQAWQDSALAMNQIKDRYVEKFPQLADAFRWRTHTLPAKGMWWTITFNLAFLVAVIDSAALGAAVHFVKSADLQNDLMLDFFSSAVFFAVQIWFYFHQLPMKKEDPASGSKNQKSG